MSFDGRIDGWGAWLGFICLVVAVRTKIRIGRWAAGLLDCRVLPARKVDQGTVRQLEGCHEMGWSMMDDMF